MAAPQPPLPESPPPMTDSVETDFADSDGVSVAYQV